MNTTINTNITDSDTTDYTEFIQSLSSEAREVISTLPDNIARHLRRFGDTWILLPNLTFTKNEFFFLTPFYSNGTLYTQLYHSFNGENHCLFYNTTLAKCENCNWVNDNYRIISFTTKIDNKLQRWLGYNVVKL